MSDEDEARRRNRERYPQIAAVVDEVRKHFPEAKVVGVKKFTPEEYGARLRELMAKAKEQI